MSVKKLPNQIRAYLHAPLVAPRGARQGARAPQVSHTGRAPDRELLAKLYAIGDRARQLRARGHELTVDLQVLAGSGERGEPRYCLEIGCFNLVRPDELKCAGCARLFRGQKRALKRRWRRR